MQGIGRTRIKKSWMMLEQAPTMTMAFLSKHRANMAPFQIE